MGGVHERCWGGARWGPQEQARGWAVSLLLPAFVTGIFSIIRITNPANP